MSKTLLSSRAQLMRGRSSLPSGVAEGPQRRGACQGRRPLRIGLGRPASDRCLPRPEVLVGQCQRSGAGQQLYEELTATVLARLGSLTEHVPAHAEPMPPYVLYLVDGRARKVRFFSLARLASELLKALGEDGAVPALRLQIAHGRGCGSSLVASTMPARLPCSKSPFVRRHNPPRPRGTRQGVGGSVRECSCASGCLRKT